jgi:hypothetical protein
MDNERDRKLVGQLSSVTHNPLKLIRVLLEDQLILVTQV